MNVIVCFLFNFSCVQTLAASLRWHQCSHCEDPDIPLYVDMISNLSLKRGDLKLIQT